MRLFISGATGWFGRRLVVDRLRRGDQVTLLTRRPAHARDLFAADVNPSVSIVHGDPTIPGEWQSWVDGCDASMHLACAMAAARCDGLEERLALGRLRLDASHQMAAAVRAARRPPEVHLALSSLEYYGQPAQDAGPVDEEAGPGQGPLSELAAAAEERAARAVRAGCRVANLRLGLLLLPADAAAAAAPEPHPRWRDAAVSWIHWADLVELVDWALLRPGATGAFNATAPHCSTLSALAEARGGATSRRAARLRPAPRPPGPPPPGVGIAALPARACAAGFRFRHRDLHQAIQSLRAGEGPRASATLPGRRVPQARSVHAEGLAGW
jgi:hypothetical protein